MFICHTLTHICHTLTHICHTLTHICHTHIHIHTLQGVDKRYNVLAYVKAASSQVASLLSRIKSDMDNSEGDERDREAGRGRRRDA